MEDGHYYDGNKPFDVTLQGTVFFKTLVNGVESAKEHSLPVSAGKITSPVVCVNADSGKPQLLFQREKASCDTRCGTLFLHCSTLTKASCDTRCGTLFLHYSTLTKASCDTSESGGACFYVLRFTSEPTHSVQIVISSSEPTEAVVAVFLREGAFAGVSNNETAQVVVNVPARDWDLPLRVAAVGVEDNGSPDGNVQYDLTVLSNSQDAHFEVSNHTTTLSVGRVLH